MKKKSHKMLVLLLVLLFVPGIFISCKKEETQELTERQKAWITDIDGQMREAFSKAAGINEYVTDDNESFVAEILEVTSEYIKTRLISGDPESATKLILKGDYIEYHPKWKSIYNKLQNIRFDNILSSGEYLDLEFVTISSDVDIKLKAGTFIKCLKDCNITVDVNTSIRNYKLISGMLYLLTNDNCYNLFNSILFFNTKEEFYENAPSDSDLAFIKETEQLYYKGLFIGGKKQEAELPPNFKIETATDGAIIVYKNGI